MARRTRRAAAIYAVMVAVLAAGACSKPKSHAPPGGPTASPTTDTALASRVPHALLAKRTLTVAVDPRYAPVEFLDSDGKTVIGFDIDLLAAVMAKLGLSISVRPTSFEQIVPAVRAGHFDLGASSIPVNSDPAHTVTMVSYFTAGTQWARRTGTTVAPENACGAQVAVQMATPQVADLTARSAACVKAHHPAIRIDPYPTQREVTDGVVHGVDEALAADSPVTGYAVLRNPDQLELAGALYAGRPYGYVLPGAETEFATAIAIALQELIVDGTYNQILAKWGVAAGGIGTPAVYPATQ